MSDSNPLALKLQAQASARPFLVQPNNFKNYTCCPTAKTVTGFDPAIDRYVAIGITCKRWTCAYCAHHKIKRLSFLTHNAEPNRLLTLTVDPSIHENPRAAFIATSPKVAELVRKLRLEVNEVEYMRVTEVTKAGFPHYHLLMRSSFIHHSKIKKTWCLLTGAKIVDVRKVHETFKAYSYLVKYLTKLHRLEWTERHVSYSRNFFNPADLEKYVFPKLEQIRRHDEHPYKYLADRFLDQEIDITGAMKWVIPNDTTLKEFDVHPDSLGLPKEMPQVLELPLHQQCLTGIDDPSTTPYE